MDLQHVDYEDYFKVIVVGDAGTGKTNMIQTFDKGIKPNHTTATVGIEYCSKVIKIDNTRKVKIQIWDTAGQQQFKAISMSHYKNSKGALVVFDVSNRNSFNNVIQWIMDVRQRCNENVVVGIIGNKIDSNRRAVSPEQGQILASQQHAFYMQTTVFDVQTLRNTFDRLAQQVYNSNKTTNLNFSRTNVNLSVNPNKSNQDNCAC